MICCNTNPHKHGKDKLGYQRYKCPICGKTFSDNPDSGKTGRKLIGDRPLTDAEKQRRYRAKKNK